MMMNSSDKTTYYPNEGHISLIVNRGKEMLFCSHLKKLIYELAQGG